MVTALTVQFICHRFLSEYDPTLGEFECGLFAWMRPDCCSGVSLVVHARTLLTFLSTLPRLSHHSLLLCAEDTYTKDVVFDGKELKVHVLDTAGYSEVGQVVFFYAYRSP